MRGHRRGLDRSSLDTPTAKTRWARWGLPTFGNGRVLYGDSRMQITSLTRGQGSDQVLFETRATRTGPVVECRNAYTGQVASIVLVSPPPPTPPAFVSSSRYAPEAAAGLYENCVIRSDVDSTGRFLASPQDQDAAEILQFRIDGASPGLWDVVDIRYGPGESSGVTVTRHADDVPQTAVAELARGPVRQPAPFLGTWSWRLSPSPTPPRPSPRSRSPGRAIVPRTLSTPLLREPQGRPLAARCACAGLWPAAG